MQFTDREITSACKMVLLDQLRFNKTLNESLSFDERDKFRKFISDLSLQEYLSILSEKPNISGEEFQGLRKLGWTVKAINKMGTATAKAAFWNEIKPDKSESESEPEKFLPVVQKTISNFSSPKNKSLPTKSPVKDTGATDLVKNKKDQYEIKQKLVSRFGLKGKIALGVGLATLLAIIAYLLYRRYKDACRKTCSKSNDRTNCMKKCRMGNIRNVIKTLSTEKSKCGANKKCAMKFEKKIRDWQGKLNKIK